MRQRSLSSTAHTVAATVCSPTHGPRDQEESSLVRVTGEGTDGEENVRRGRCDRDLHPLVRGTLDQRGVHVAGGGPQDDPQVPGPGGGGRPGPERASDEPAGLGCAGDALVPAP